MCTPCLRVLCQQRTAPRLPHILFTEVYLVPGSHPHRVLGFPESDSRARPPQPWPPSPELPRSLLRRPCSARAPRPPRPLAAPPDPRATTSAHLVLCPRFLCASPRRTLLEILPISLKPEAPRTDPPHSRATRRPRPT